MSTAEEIYDKHYKKWQNSSMSLRLATIEAMEAFADQFRSQYVENKHDNKFNELCKEQEQEIERLKADLKRAEEYKPQIEDQAKTERVMVIAAELESEYQQEIERLKEIKVFLENEVDRLHGGNDKLKQRIAELEAQLNIATENLKACLEIKGDRIIELSNKIKALESTPTEQPEAQKVVEALEETRKDFCIWYYAQSKPLDANKVFEWFRARKSSDGPVSSKQNQPQPEKFKDEIPQLAQSLEGTYATTGKPDNLNERIYSLSDLGNSAKKLHDAVGKMEKEEQSAIKEAERAVFADLKWKIGQILSEKFLEYNDGKFHSSLELNPATHAITEFVFNTITRKQP